MKTGWAIAAMTLWLAPAQAQQPVLPMNGEQFTSALRARIEQAQALAPIAEPTCGKPVGSRYCKSQVTSAVKLVLVDDALQGNKLVEVAIYYDPRIGEPIDGTVFDSICAASLRVFRPRLSASSAEARYKTALRRAINAAPSSPGKIGESVVKGSPDTFVVEVDPGHSIICKITSQSFDD